MPNPHLVTDGKTFKTDHGGCRPPTKEESDKIPPIPQHVLDKLAAKAAERAARKADPNAPPQDVKGSAIATYLGRYRPESQGGTGCCTACAADVAMMQCAITQDVNLPQLSWGFGYYSHTHDATFRLGDSVSGAVLARITSGCCENSFYSQDWVLKQWALWPGGNFNSSQLPQPPAYADALTRKVLQAYRVPYLYTLQHPDLDIMDQLLDAGHPIAFGLGNHAMCLLERSSDGYWYYGMDSEIYTNQSGMGVGVRVFSRTALAGAYDLVTVMAVEPGSVIVPPPPPPPPTGNTQMLLDTIKADANGLVLGQITQTQVDKIKADVAMLQADAPAIPAPGVEMVWFDDVLPPSAVAGAREDGWNWISTNPAPFSGTKAHQSALLAGAHQHLFTGAAFPVVAGDTLFAYVYLDPANPPRQVMLQWNDGSWEHRAYWGTNLLPYGGVDGTAGRRNMGPLPPTGQWVRLEVPAALVGLEGRTLNGMAFSLYDGRATWDRCGKL